MAKRVETEGSNASPKKGDNKKNEKKNQGVKIMSQQSLQQAQAQKIRQFFDKQLQNSHHTISIQPLNDLISANIIKGEIMLPEKPRPIQALIKPPEQQIPVKISQQQMEMYQKQAKRIEHIKLISNLNKQLANKQPQDVIPYILTKQQHERKIRQFLEEKRRRQKKLEESKKMLQQKQQKQEKIKIEHSTFQKNQQKQRKRIQIQQKITKQKEQHIHFLSLQIKHRKDLEQIVAKMPLYVKMENNFKQTIQMPQLQKKKQQYKSLRDFKDRYSVDKIQKHQKQYIKKLNWKLQQSKVYRTSTLNTSQQQKSKNIEKSNKLKSILAEEMHKNKLKWTSKQTYIQEKVKRQQNYLKKLKEEHKPKIDSQKRKEIQIRLIKQKQHLAKVGLGINQKKIGLSYLGQLKKKTQRWKLIQGQRQDQITLKQQYQSETLLPILKRSQSSSSVFTLNKNNFFMEKARENKLSKILNSQEENQQKLQKLKILSKQLQQSKSMKLQFLKHNFNEEASQQASNISLNSIKAKMGLIQLMKKQQL